MMNLKRNIEKSHKAYDRGDFTGALEGYEKIISNGYYDKDVYLIAGVLHSELGDHERAVELFEDVMSNESDAETGALYIAISFHERGQLDRAIEFYKKSIDFGSKLRGGIVGRLGIALLMKGERGEALDWIKKVESIDKIMYRELMEMYRGERPLAIHR